MRTYLTILLLTLSISAFSNSVASLDTIATWHVLINDQTIEEYNDFFKLRTIELTKGKIKLSDTLITRYFDDMPCPDCNSELIIKSEKGEILKTLIYSDNGKHEFRIVTPELQVLAFNSKSNILNVHYRKKSDLTEHYLYSIEIK